MLLQEAVARRARLEEERLAELMRDCTFRPHTNEAQNMELMKRMLASDDDSTIIGQGPSGSEMSVVELLLAYDEDD